jgi:hypothetical protein
MGISLENLWVSIIDSNRFRKYTRRGIGRRFFRSEVYQTLRFTKNRIGSSFAVAMNSSQFQNVQTFCLFVGHNKSGTSMLGSLLDAHPNIILADEVDALGHVYAGFKREQIFHVLIKGSRRELMKGRVTARRLTPYSYLVPEQWQGRFSQLTVIGDGKAGSSTRRFAADPHLLDRLDAVMGTAEVKLIQVIRNPFDVISVMMVRGKRSFENSINHYFTSCNTLAMLHQRLGSVKIHSVRYEEFVEHPQEKLAQLCNYLGVESHADYLTACAKIIHSSPDQSRRLVDWTPAWINTVQEMIDRYEFLKGYRFES